MTEIILVFFAGYFLFRLYRKRHPPQFDKETQTEIMQVNDNCTQTPPVITIIQSDFFNNTSSSSDTLSPLSDNMSLESLSTDLLQFDLDC